MRSFFTAPSTMPRAVERAIVWTTVVATIAWSIGLSFLIRVPFAQAGVPAYSGGGPPGGQSFVPPDALIDINASEAIDNSTLTPDNVSLLECTGTTEPTSCPGTTGSNLCTGVTLSNTTRITCDHDPLSTEKVYRFRIGTGVLTSVGPAGAAANVDRIFKTSGFFGGSGGSNMTPPVITPVFPTSGSQFPINAFIVLQFPAGPEGDMKTGADTVGSVTNVANFTVQAVTNGTPGGTDLCGAGCTLTWNSGGRILTIVPSTLTAGTQYQLQTTGLQNNANINLAPMPPLMFTAAALDQTAPTLRTNSPTSPANAAINVSPLTPEVTVAFSEDILPSTLTLSTVRLCTDSTAGTAGCEAGDTRLTDTAKFGIRYDQFDHVARLSLLANDSLAVSTKYCIEIVGGASGVKDMIGNEFTTSSSTCFTTGGSATDTVTGSPKLLFADADNYKLVAKFTEAMRSADLITGGNVNTSNIELQCPVGVTINLSGKPATYRTDVSELEIQQLGLQNGQDCRLTVTTARDLAGNGIDTANSANIANFQIQSATTTGGFLGTGGVQSNDFFGGSGGTAATFWEKPQRCQPRTNATNKETGLECEFPAPAALPIGSTFTLSFPSTFTMSGSAGNTRLVPAAQSFMNADVNGPGTGTVTLTASTDTGAKTVTLTTVGAALVSGDMVRFDLDRLTTPTSPANDLRISIIVKNDSGVKLGQTIQAAPFTINQAGALSIAGKVCKGTTSGGVCGDSDTNVAGAKIFCDQFGGFVQDSANSGFMGHQETTSAADGTWTISGLVAGQYGCGMPPQPGLAALQDTGGTPPFQQISLTTANKTGADFKVKNLAGVSGKTLTVNITGPASTDLDVFCSAGMSSYEFSAPVMKQVTLDGAGSGTTTLQLQGGQTYECGVGPHMPFEQFGNGAPPPPPTFTFMPPKPQQVVVPTDANPTALTFSLLSASLTINATVQDGSASGIANVFVHATPVGCFDATTGEQKDCFGSFAQTNPSGIAALKVGPGTYEIGADGPGLPPSTREIVTITSGTTAVTLKMTKSSTTIAGQILDESGNGIKYAHVNGEKRTITSGTDACDFSNSRPAGGFSDSPTDESGNYTLYAAAGTWCVRAFAPSYGEVGTKTVTVTGSTSQTGQNIQASSGNFGTISGAVTKGGSNVSGAFVNCFSPGTGGNGAPTNTDGTYSLKVKLPSSGTATYTCDGFAPGIGPLTRQTTVLGGATTTAAVSFTMGNPGTITVTIANITDAFCDARDSNGFGAPGGRASSTGVYTINAPAGTYTVRCMGPKYGRILEQSGVIVTAGGTTAVTGTAPTVRTVTGRITDGTSNLSGTTLTFTDSLGKSFSTTTGSQSGSNANLSVTGVPEGTYTIKASKKSYDPAVTTASVSGGNLTLSTPLALTPTNNANGEEVTIPVQASGAAYTGDATVIATQTSGGTTKTIVADVDQTTGNAALPLANGTWSVKAIGDNGKESAASTVTVSAGSLVAAAPTLAIDTNISGYTQKSGSETMSLSGGGLAKFSDLAVGGKTPEINVPASTLSQSDSSTGKIEMKSDPTLKDIDPGTDANFVGSYGYDITPKDANGNAITTGMTGSVTITIPYTDDDVAAAGVNEADLKFGAFNTSSQAWETFATTVDTTNNLLTAQVTHFSSFGVIGAQASGSTGSGDATPPAAPTNVQATATTSKVTLTWTDPADSDFLEVEVLRSNPPSTAVSGTPLNKVAKGVKKYEDTAVLPFSSYSYILRAKDTSGNTRNSETIMVTTPQSASEAPTTGTTTTAPSSGGSTPTPTTGTTTPTTTTAPALTLSLPDGVYLHDRIRTAASGALYLVARDGKRYLYPNEVIYRSWHENFNGVKRVTDAQMAAIPLGGIVTVRPGTWLVKIESDPKVYAIEANGVRRWIETEARAQLLYGSNWNRMILDIPVSYWGSYPAGQPLGADVHPTGSIVRTSDGLQTFFIDLGKKRAVSGASFSGHGYQERFVRTLAAALSYVTGNALLTSDVDVAPLYWYP